MRQLCNIYRDCPSGVGYPADAYSDGDRLLRIRAIQNNLHLLKAPSRTGMSQNAVGMKIRCIFFDNRSAF